MAGTGGSASPPEETERERRPLCPTGEARLPVESDSTRVRLRPAYSDSEATWRTGQTREFQTIRQTDRESTIH